MSLRTNSPRVSAPVTYARVMGERVNMNREGLMAHTRMRHTDRHGIEHIYADARVEREPNAHIDHDGESAHPARIQYLGMAKPDPRTLVPLSRPRTAAHKRALAKPHYHYADGNVTLCATASARKPCTLWNDK